jgi:hypothetical protein
VSKLLIIAGSLLAVLGIALIPLPGPGHLLLIVGVVFLLVGFLERSTSRRGSDKKS